MNLRGLYVITDPALTPGAQLIPAVAQALAGGAALVQYRAKLTPPTERREQAEALHQLCRAAQVGLIINDDLELALAVRAEGLHLGRDDGDLRAARVRLGPDALIGASCYADLARAENAVAAGASYLAFGSVFPSATKPTAHPVTLELIRTARRRFTLPIAAIGGINAANAPSVLAAGADLLAVISGVFAAPDIRQASASFSVLCSAVTRQ